MQCEGLLQSDLMLVAPHKLWKNLLGDRTCPVFRSEIGRALVQWTGTWWLATISISCDAVSQPASDIPTVHSVHCLQLFQSFYWQFSPCRTCCWTFVARRAFCGYGKISFTHTSMSACVCSLHLQWVSQHSIELSDRMSVSRAATRPECIVQF